MSPASQRPVGFRLGWAAIRPATLWAAVVPVGVGSALAAAEGRFRGDLALSALVCAVLIQIGTNLFNDWADFRRGADTLERLGPARVTQQGWLKPQQVLKASALAFASAVLCGSYAVWAAGWPVVWMGLASVLAGLAYTGGPYPLAYHGWGEVCVGLFFGLLAVCGTYYLQTLSVSWTCGLAAGAVGALAMAILGVNNLRDRTTDAAAGKQTLAVRLGDTVARRQYALWVASAYGIVGILALRQPHRPGWLLPCLSLPWAVACVRDMQRWDGAALNGLLVRTAQLEAVFGLLLGIGALL